MSDSTNRPRIPRILIVDDDPTFHQRMLHVFRQHFDFEGVETIDKLWPLLEKDHHFDLILLDLALSPDSDDKTLGLEMVGQLHQKLPNTPLLVVTNRPDYKSATTAVQRGAKDYLAKDSYDEEVWFGTFRRLIAESSIPRMFISYAHEDREHKEVFLNKLKALQNTKFDMEVREDGQIQYGRQWKSEIDRLMDGANVFVFLVSDFLLASDFVTKVEFKAAWSAHEQYGALIVPVLLTPSQWQASKLASFQKLPVSKEYLNQFHDRDEGWFEVIKGLKDMLEREFPASVRPI